MLCNPLSLCAGACEGTRGRSSSTETWTLPTTSTSFKHDDDVKQQDVFLKNLFYSYVSHDSFHRLSFFFLVRCVCVCVCVCVRVRVSVSRTNVDVISEVDLIPLSNKDTGRLMKTPVLLW